MVTLRIASTRMRAGGFGNAVRECAADVAPLTVPYAAGWVASGMLKTAVSRDRTVSRDPEATREAILTAATDEFAAFGLGGARVDRIAARAGINKRMLYYYFGQKEDLFLAVLERAYAKIRGEEQNLNLTQVEPTEAIRRLIEFTWNYHI